MLTAILNCRRIDLLTGEARLNPAQEARYRLMRQRRNGGEPLQYILGSCDFMGLTFKVSPDVLIPRPETELLVERVVRAYEQNGSCRLLDLGTGSGCMAVAAAVLLPESQVVAVDISEAALRVARANAQRHAVESRVCFVQEDMRRFLDQTAESFDVVMSNPPYIPTSALKDLPQEVRREPVLALDGGRDGLRFYREVIPRAVDCLAVGGCLMMEIGDDQRAAIEEMVAGQKGVKQVCWHKDYRGTDRIIEVRV